MTAISHQLARVVLIADLGQSSYTKKPPGSDVSSLCLVWEATSPLLTYCKRGRTPSAFNVLMATVVAALDMAATTFTRPLGT